MWIHLKTGDASEIETHSRWTVLSCQMHSSVFLTTQLTQSQPLLSSHRTASDIWSTNTSLGRHSQTVSLRLRYFSSLAAAAAAASSSSFSLCVCHVRRSSQNAITIWGHRMFACRAGTKSASSLSFLQVTHGSVGCRQSIELKPGRIV